MKAKRAYRYFEYETEFLDYKRLCRYLREQEVAYTCTTSCGESGTVYCVSVDIKFENYLF